MDNDNPQRPTVRGMPLFAMVVSGFMATAANDAAYAICLPSGQTVTCDSLANVLAPAYLNNASNLNVNVTPNATIGSLLGIGNALTLGGNNIALYNAGRIDPSLLGVVSLLGSGTVIGNGGPSTVSVNNTGVMNGASGLIGVSLADLTGLALNVNNGAGGTTSIVNSGSIGTASLLSLNLLGTAPTLAVHGGGKVDMVNTSTGVVTGRVAFERSAEGNTFVNEGTLHGSLSMGAAGRNTFTNVAGSVVDDGGAGVGVGIDLLGVVGLNIGFAAVGKVDGGAGGDNELKLQASAGNPALQGTLAADKYINFNRLTVGSGTWNVSGDPGITGLHTLDGGLLRFDNAAALGSGNVVANGGAIEALPGVNALSNSFTLNGTGLGIEGAKNLALDGTLSGPGALRKNGTSTLRLNGVNTYSGGTDLAAGTLQLGNAAALGAGTLRATGGTLDVLPAATLGNAIAVTNSLTLTGTSALTLNGTISGSGSLIKNGAGDLTLNGPNTYTGGTTFNGGRLTVGYGAALGIGALTMAAGTSIDANAPVSLSNAISFLGDLSLVGTQALTLAGPVSVGGAVVKQGAATVTLAGTNTFTGPLSIVAGAVRTLGNGALGNTTSIDVSTGASLLLGGNASAPRLSGTGTIDLAAPATLTVGSGGLDDSFAGTVTGAGKLAKTGAGRLTLNGINTYSGGTDLAAGTLQLGNASALGTGTLRAAGGTLDVQPSSTLGNAIDLAGTLSLSGASALTLNGPITGAGALNKLGAADLRIDGANTFGGGVTLASGKLVVGNDAALGTGALRAGAGTRLEAAAPTTLGNAVQLGGALAIDGAQALTLAGTVSGVGGLVKGNAGDLVLNGPNAFFGGVALDAGRLVVGSNTALGFGTLTAAAGTTLDATAPVSLSNAMNLLGDLSIAGSQPMTLSGSIAGAGGLRKTGMAELTLAGNNSFNGPLSIVAGAVRTVGAAALGNPSAVDIGDGAALRLGGNADLRTLTGTGSIDIGPAATLTLGGSSTDSAFDGTLAGAGKLAKTGAGRLTLNGVNTYAGGTDLSAGKLVLGNSQAIGTGTLAAAAGTALEAAAPMTLANAMQLAGALNIEGAQALTLAGPIGGAGRLAKGNAGDLVLNGANTFAGGVALDAGRLVVGNDGALGTGTLTAASGTVLDANTPVSLSNAMSLLGELTVTGNQAMTLSGALSGAGGLRKTGSFTLTLSGPNSFDGALSIVSGAVRTLGNSALGNASSIDIGSAGELHLGGDADARALSGGGLLDIAPAATLTLGSSGLDSVFDGTLGGTGQVRKAGAGTLRFNGTGSVGGTTVAAGRLVVGDAAHTIASLGGPVTVASGGTLAGHGTVGGIGDSVTIANGATLAPGVDFVTGSSAGSLKIGGSLTMAQGSTLDLGLATGSGRTTVTGVGHSVDVAGDLALDGATVNIGDLGGYGPGLYRMFSYGGSLSRSNGGVALGSTPGGVPVLQFLTASKQINYINAQGFTLGMWNADGAADSSRMGGGSGVWSTTSPQWTDAIGSVTTAMQPAAGFAIFGGQSGTVTIDNTAGAVQTTGMQFAVDGYRLNGGALGLLGSSGTTVPGINVGDGSASSTAMTATIDNVLAGTAGLRKLGAGTLRLNAANTYSGDTLIDAGVLSVGSDSALGALANRVVLNGGSLRVTGTAMTDSARDMTLGAAGGSIDVADATNSLRLARALAGTGGLVKVGAGKLVLAGINSYAGGTTISAGTLQIGDGGTTGSLIGDVVNNGTLAFNRADALNFDGAISGLGGIAQLGGGHTTLRAVNRYAGGTLIKAGTLTGSATSFGSGAIVNDAALVIDQASADGTMANVFTGVGRLAKLGVRTLTLTGNSAAFAGTTLVGEGTLAVQGALGGALTVANGAVITGTGTVGSLTVLDGGTLAPGGDEVGTLRATGNMRFARGAFYRLGVNPQGGDFISMTGSALLEGGEVSTLGATGNWSPNAMYRILKADGGVVGTFSGVDSDFAFLTPSLGYDADSVWLKLSRNDVSFPSIATTPNESAAGAGVESLPDNAPVYQAVVQLDTTSARLAFAQLAGDSHASLRGAMLDGSHFARDAAADRLRNADGDDSAPSGNAAGDASGRKLWMRGIGSWGRNQATDANHGTTRLKSEAGGAFVGADQRVGDGWRVGAMGGYTRSTHDIAARRSHAIDEAYHAGVYAGTHWGALAFRSGAVYSHHAIDTERTVVFPGVSDTPRASFRARTAQVFGELGWRIDAAPASVEPFINFAYADLHTDGFVERGGEAALVGRPGSMGVGFGTVGLRASMPVLVGPASITLRGMIGARRATGDVVPTATLAFPGGADFAVSGLPIARNTLVLEGGFDMAVARNLSIGASYTGQAASGAREHGVKANLVYKF